MERVQTRRRAPIEQQLQRCAAMGFAHIHAGAKVHQALCMLLGAKAPVGMQCAPHQAIARAVSILGRADRHALIQIHQVLTIELRCESLIVSAALFVIDRARSFGHDTPILVREEVRTTGQAAATQRNHSRHPHICVGVCGKTQQLFLGGIAPQRVGQGMPQRRIGLTHGRQALDQRGEGVRLRCAR